SLRFAEPYLTVDANRIGFYPPKRGGNQVADSVRQKRRGDNTCWAKPRTRTCGIELNHSTNRSHSFESSEKSVPSCVAGCFPHIIESPYTHSFSASQHSISAAIFSHPGSLIMYRAWPGYSLKSARYLRATVRATAAGTSLSSVPVRIRIGPTTRFASTGMPSIPISTPCLPGAGTICSYTDACSDGG